MEITIKLDATPALLNAINALAVAYASNIQPPIPAAAGQVALEPQIPKAEVPKAEIPQVEIPQVEIPQVEIPQAQVSQATQAETISLETFRKTIGDKSRVSAANKEKVKAVLTAHGYAKVTQVPPEERESIMAELEAI
ncbi:MAG: hypothetical protein LBQ68_07960 [Clostridiales bacterium]|nr:hypothetical protein [Clostridiales bacterium]